MEHGEARQRSPRHTDRDAALQAQLLARRDRLRLAVGTVSDSRPLQDLLVQVDAALDRLDAGTFGVCETCHDEIESERLLTDPLCRNCLDHLSAAERRALERDLDLASQVQRGLLPGQGAVGKGWTMAYHYEPVGAVSGDYCDLIRLEDGACLFLLGDVMGKGVAASMLTAHLHAIFRSLSTPTRTLPDLVARANRIFCEGIMSGFFATLVAGQLRPDGDVEICNAGHCLPLHLQAGSISAVEPTNLPLGLYCDAEFTSHHLRLEPGDRLVAYTDGLSEAMNVAGEQYEVGRLTAFLHRQRPLPADRIVAELLEDLRGFRGTTAAADDLTIMAIRREA